MSIENYLDLFLDPVTDAFTPELAQAVNIISGNSEPSSLVRKHVVWQKQDVIAASALRPFHRLAPEAQ